ncbi:MAG: NAD(+) diphosphatase [Cognaticolwellia sp.]
MKNELTFCQMPLNRASTLRKDKTWLQEQVRSQSSHYYFFWRGKYLYLEQEIHVFSKENAINAGKIKPCKQVMVETLDASDLIFLGLNNTEAYFVCDLSHLTEEAIALWLDTLAIDNIKFIDFRRSLSLLTHQQGAILSYAKALIHWQQSALHCGFCGSKTNAADGGHRRVCSNSGCEKEQFPRTDPAVIMLVEYQPETGPALCLLAEHHRTPELMFSTLAGFVDPGESLAEAVTREVLEEAGVQVSDVCYIDSQPWPFPNSLMIGFIAQAQGTDLCLEEEELRNAEWFTAEQLTNFKDWGDDGEGPKLPRKESIARLLIDLWCEKQLALTADITAG